MKYKTMLMAATLLASSAAFVPTAASAQATPIPGVKNVIIIINDGGGETVYDAGRLYAGHALVTDGPGFKKIHVSTYPLRSDGVVDGVNHNAPGTLLQEAGVVYNSAKFWDTTPAAGLPTAQTTGCANFVGPLSGQCSILGGSTATGYGSYPAGFQGYEFSRFAHPDSGNTASALASGKKTYNNAINVDGSGAAQVTITDLIDVAKKVGKRTGVVSTVQFADATPAALGGAHNVARANRTAIAAEMFSAGKLDVIGGTGNPDYDDNGQPRTANYSWIGAAHWADLKAGTNTSGLNKLKWPLLQNRTDIEALANGTVKPPIRVAMIMKADNSTQYNRTGVGTNWTLHEPYNASNSYKQCDDPTLTATDPCQQPFNTAVPSFQSLTVAALNALGKRGRGFYLMAEAGAVDRAEHGNSTGRMIEELNDSEDTVQAIIDWVNRADTPATWDDTLLIVTADHDHLLYGPDAATVPFEPLQDKGAGKTPGNLWLGPNHGTGLVPLFAYGKGSDEIAALATQTDSYTDGNGNTYGYGAYTDQTILGATLKATLGVTQ